MSVTIRTLLLLSIFLGDLSFAANLSPNSNGGSCTIPTLTDATNSFFVADANYCPLAVLPSSGINGQTITITKANTQNGTFPFGISKVYTDLANTIPDLVSGQFVKFSYSSQRNLWLLNSASPTVSPSQLSTTQPTDNGNLWIRASVSPTTCFLNISSGSSSASGNNQKVLNLGKYSSSQVPATEGTAFGTPITAIFQLQNAQGSAGPGCSSLPGASYWDIGIDIDPKTLYTTSTGDTLLLSVSPLGSDVVAQSIGVLLKTSFGPSVTEGTSKLNLKQSSLNFGTLLSQSTTTPNVPSSSKIAVTATFVRVSTDIPVTNGLYSRSIPLNVFYK